MSNGLPRLTKSRLRIALIVDSFVQPSWMRRVCENILASELAEIGLVVKTTTDENQPLSPNAGHLLYKFYNWLDRLVFRPKPDAIEQVSIEDLVAAYPVIAIEAGGLSEVHSQKIKAFNVDVALNFGSSKMNEKLAKLAKHGVWFYPYGREEPFRQTLLGFWEVMNQEPITSLSLGRLYGDPPTEEIIYSSWSPTLSSFSVRLNSNSCYWKSSAFVVRKLGELYGNEEAGVECEGSSSIVARSTGRSLEIPSNATMARLLLKLALKAGLRSIEKTFSSEQWILAFRINESNHTKCSQPLQYVTPPADRFWADPFPLVVEGRYYIFFEEFLHSQDKAHISVIEIDKKGIKNGPTEVLNRDYHLSYPFIFEWKGTYYMIPESGDKNVVQLYRATSFPFTWEPDKVLLEATCPLDATLVDVKGRWWMFVNIQEEGVRVNWDELHLYYAESPLGPWQPHARNPIVSDVRSARPAGRLFWAKNVLYRPSQDSSIRYGYATTINEIITLEPNEYYEKEVLKILPDWDRNILGVHTLNLLNEITVIDCLTKRSWFNNDKLRPPSRLGTTQDILQWQTRST